MPPQEDTASRWESLKIKHLQQIPQAVQMRVLHRYHRRAAHRAVHLQEARTNQPLDGAHLGSRGISYQEKESGVSALLWHLLKSSLLRQERETLLSLFAHMWHSYKSGPARKDMGLWTHRT